MKLIKRLTKCILYTLAIPVLYILLSLGLSLSTVNKEHITSSTDKTIYIKTNGVHLDIILPKEDIIPALLSDIHQYKGEDYIAFGWGDENFYINTPTWNDLTFNNAFSAMFLKSSTLMHVTRYTQPQNDWIKINLSDGQFYSLNMYIKDSFTTDSEGHKIHLKNQGYTPIDDFYKANGSYSCMYTCNTWVNSAFKYCGLKACTWTPFDFGVLNKYR